MRDLSPVQSFAIRSLMVVAIMGIALGLAVNWTIERVVVDSAIETARVSANSLIVHSLQHTPALSYPLDPELVGAVDDMVDKDIATANLSAVKLWAPDGILLYSTNPDDQVGTSYAGKTELVAAMDGESTARVERVGRSENRNQFDEVGALIEVYSPIIPEEGMEPAGIFEVYKSYGSVSSATRDASFVIWGVILLGSVIVYGTQITMFKRATDRLSETEAELSTLNGRLEGSLRHMEEHSLGTLQALISAVDAKDSYTASHSMSVTDYAKIIGRRMRLSREELDLLERAGLLHDIGKIGVPERVLLKPSKLTDEEFEVIKEHSAAGAQIVEEMPFLRDAVPVVRHHHERWDGKGYPDGLSAESIPLLARILCVADAFDAMTSNRPYRKSQKVAFARREILKYRGIQFCPQCADALLEALDMGEIRVGKREEMLVS